MEARNSSDGATPALRPLRNLSEDQLVRHFITSRLMDDL